MAKKNQRLKAKKRQQLRAKRDFLKAHPRAGIRISVAMIARNEENHLVACMESAKRFAQEVVLVDTGSTDRTKAVARELGMKVYTFDWIHDFAAARNFSFSKCKGDYIFWQDPDEVVPEECAIEVSLLADLGMDEDIDEFRMLTALNGTYRPPEEDIPGYGPGFRVLKPRMVRNCREVSWRFRIHESLEWARSIKRFDVDEKVWVFNHGSASAHDTKTGDDYYYALMVLGHRDYPNEPHFSLYLAESSLVKENDPVKAAQYLDTVKDPKKLGSPELQEKYWVMRGRAFKMGAIFAIEQGNVDAANKQAQQAIQYFDRAVQCKGSHRATLEGATLALYMGNRDAFVGIVDGVLQDTPGDLQAQYMRRLADLEEDAQKLNALVGNWLFNLKGGRYSMEQAFQMVTQGVDPQQIPDIEGAWNEQDDRWVYIIIGYRITDQPERTRNLHACLRALLGQEHTGFTVALVEQDVNTCGAILESDLYVRSAKGKQHLFDRSFDAFNRGRAFNFGASHCGAKGNDLLCLMDADMIVDPLWVKRCLDNIAWAEKNGRFPGALLPYTQAIYMNRETTDRVIEAGDPTKVDTIAGETYHSQGGCIWITAELYERMGGHDEQFVGWGSADRDFYLRLGEAIQGVPPRISQPLYHMWHPKPDESRAEENSDLFKKKHPQIKEAEAAKI